MSNSTLANRFAGQREHFAQLCIGIRLNIKITRGLCDISVTMDTLTLSLHVRP